MGKKIMELDSSLESTKTLYTISPNWGETLFFFFGCSFVSFFIMVMVRMAIGWGRTKGWSSSFVLSHPYPTLHIGKNFLAPSPLLGALQRPAPPRKILFFVNFPYNQYTFFNETYFINKNILEITTKFIPSNQINFQK